MSRGGAVEGRMQMAFVCALGGSACDLMAANGGRGAVALSSEPWSWTEYAGKPRYCSIALWHMRAWAVAVGGFSRMHLGAQEELLSLERSADCRYVHVRSAGVSGDARWEHALELLACWAAGGFALAFYMLYAAGPSHNGPSCLYLPGAGAFRPALGTGKRLLVPRLCSHRSRNSGAGIPSWGRAIR